MERQDYVFDFERLDVYQKSLELVRAIFRMTRGLPKEYQFSVTDQFRRAGLSVLNNIAEGSGKQSKKEKAQFYKTSLNSARECIPMLTVLFREEQISADVHRTMRQEILHIANMLGKLVGSLG